MFHHPKQKPNLSPTERQHDLMAVTAPDLIYADSRRHALLTKIKASSALDTSQFDTLCLTLLKQVANQYQSLPETAHGYYASPGGLLDHALNRTEAALHLFRHGLMHDEKNTPSEEQKRWMYALFSAGLLQGIGKLQLDYCVTLFDKNQRPLRSWNPLLEQLASVGHYYDHVFQKNLDNELRCRLNVLLAYQLMPREGFAWIAGNPRVLETWLALLHEDSSTAEMLGAILERADAIAIQRDLNALAMKGGHSSGTRPAHIGTFIDVAPESTVEKEQLIGAAFIKWLTDALKKGLLTINQSPVFMTPDGLVILPETFQLFIRETPEYKPWQAVQKGLLNWGLHRCDANGRIMSPDIQRGANGLILNKYGVVLPDEFQVHNPKTGHTASMTAMEFVRMQQSPNQLHSLQQLSASGAWASIEATPLASQTVFSRRE